MRAVRRSTVDAADPVGAVLEIDGVHPVDAYQKDMAALVIVIRIKSRSAQRRQQNSNHYQVAFQEGKSHRVRAYLLEFAIT